MPATAPEEGAVLAALCEAMGFFFLAPEVAVAPDGPAVLRSLEDPLAAAVTVLLLETGPDGAFLRSF